MENERCNAIVSIQSKENPYAFIGDAAKDKYMRSLFKLMEGEEIHLIGFYCCDEYVKIICMDTDESALLEVIHINNKQYGGYCKRVLGTTFNPDVEIEYAESEELLMDMYCRVMCGRAGSAFFAEYPWSSVFLLQTEEYGGYLYQMMDFDRLMSLFGYMYALEIVMRIIIIKGEESRTVKSRKIVENQIWKLGQYQDIEDFIKRANTEEKRSLAQSLFLVHGFSYTDISIVLRCSRSTVYRYLRQ
jgi:hypothetical protein